MAHGDALIFLTNIVWIFLLFLFIYLFFVVFFLPSFYKKFRIRVLVRGLLKTVSIFSIRNILVSLTFFSEFVRDVCIKILGFLNAALYFFSVKRTPKFSIKRRLVLLPHINTFTWGRPEKFFPSKRGVYTFKYKKN